MKGPLVQAFFSYCEALQKILWLKSFGLNFQQVRRGNFRLSHGMNSWTCTWPPTQTFVNLQLLSFLASKNTEKYVTGEEVSNKKGLKIGRVRLPPLYMYSALPFPDGFTLPGRSAV